MIRTVLYLASEAVWSVVFRIAGHNAQRRDPRWGDQFRADAKVREDIQRNLRRKAGKA